MEFSPIERLILANQYRILEELDPHESEWYTKARKILERGFELHYEEIVGHLSCGTDAMSEEECEEVLDILTMFEALKRARAKFGEIEGVEDYQIQFGGFDGNNESKQLSYSEFYCSLDGGRFTELDQQGGLNSHMSVLEKYRRQLEEWNKSGDRNELNESDVLRIARAAIHPDNR